MFSGSVCCEACCTSCCYDAFWAEGLETLAAGPFFGPNQVGLLADLQLTICQTLQKVTLKLQSAQFRTYRENSVQGTLKCQRGTHVLLQSIVLFCLCVPNELNTFVYLLLCLFCARIFFHSFLMSVYNNMAFFFTNQYISCCCLI